MIEFTTNQWIAISAVAVPVILWLLDKYFGIIRAFWNWNKKPERIEVKVEADTIPEGADGKVVLTMEGYERQVRQRIADAMEQRDEAEGEDRERLNGQISELEGRLQNIEPAFESAKTRIRELEQLLEREGNQLGHERLERAEKALAAGDFDEADKLLAEISAEEDLAVQRKARAEYGRGQIAEEQIRWHDAAEHYCRAAQLDATNELLAHAAMSKWRLGEYADAEAIAKQALLKEGVEGDPEWIATWNNHLGLYLRLQGRLKEAEPYARKAMEIGADVGSGPHIEHAKMIDILAGLLQQKGRPKEAEPLFRQAIEIDKATLARDIPTMPPPSTISRACCRPWAGWRRQSRCFGRPSRSARPRLGRGIRTMPSASTISRACCGTWAGWRRPSRSTGYRQAIEIGKASLGSDHPEYAVWPHNLALLLLDMGKQEDAKPLLAESLAIFRKAQGDDHPNTRKIAGNFAIFLRNHFPDDPALVAVEAVFGEDIGR